MSSRLARIAGAILVGDGLRRVLGRRAGIRRRGERGPTRARHRLVGAAEALLGLAVLERAPIEPATLYLAVAPVYDHLSPIWRDWLYRDALDSFEDAVATALADGDDVLDLGCGTGAVLERLMGLKARFATYTGVDLSPAMLARARARFGRLASVRFEQRDLRIEAPPPGPFDLVLSAWALEHLPEPGRAVEMARSRLRPGGRLVLFFELDGAGPRMSALRRLWRFFGVRLVPEAEVRTWAGLVSLRRFAALGPDVAVAVLVREPVPSPPRPLPAFQGSETTSDA